jgi:segregation and condensation protein B
MGIRAQIEAIIYAAEEPVTLGQLAAVLGDDAEAILAAEAAAEPASETQAEASESEAIQSEISEGGALFADEEARAKREQKEREKRIKAVLKRETDALIAEYAASERGMEVREVAGGYRMATKPEYHDLVRGFIKSLKPPMKLSLQALETLAVIAYKQPVTAPEISEIRGVDTSGVLGSLIARKLITTAGRKQVVGRPILYKTTREFLLRFGLKDLTELPSIEEFEKMAVELAEQDDLPMPAENGENDTETAEAIREELAEDLMESEAEHAGESAAQDE